MKTLLTFATIALSVAALAAGPKEGLKKHGPRGPMMEGPSDPVVRLVTNPKMAEKIGLTPEQRGKIKEIGNESRKGMDELRRQLKDTMEKQAELLKAEKVDEAAVMAEIDKAFDIRKDMAKRQTKRIIQIKAILTPEQVEKALKEIKDRPKTAKAKDKPKAESDRGDNAAACKDCAEKESCENCEKNGDDGEKPRKHPKPRKPREMPPDED